MDDDLDKLEKLESKLYSKTTKSHSASEENVLHHKEYAVPPSWQQPPSYGQTPAAPLVASQKQPPRGLKIALIAAAAFFVLAVGFAVLTFFNGSNTLSNQNVSILVSGPSAVQSGDDLALQVVVTNN